MKTQHFQAMFDTIEAKDGMSQETQKVKKGTVIRGYASTPRVDRSNDVVEPEAFRKSIITTYKKNPIILYQHDANRPIGKATHMSIDDDGLFIEAVIHDKDVEEKIEQEILKTFSIGFIPKAIDYFDEDGEKLDPENNIDHMYAVIFDPKVKRVIKKVDLVENSIVSVPANPDALFTMEKSLAKYHQDDFKQKFLDENEKDVLCNYKNKKQFRFPLSEGWTKQRVLKWLHLNYNLLDSLTFEDMTKKNLLNLSAEEEKKELDKIEAKEEEKVEAPIESEKSEDSTAEPVEAPESDIETPADETGGEEDGGETDADDSPEEGETEQPEESPEDSEPQPQCDSQDEGTNDSDGEEKALLTPSEQKLALKAIAQLSAKCEKLEEENKKRAAKPAKQAMIYSSANEKLEKSAGDQPKPPTQAPKEDNNKPHTGIKSWIQSH